MAKEPLLTMQEVAEYLQISLSTVRRWVGRGVVPHYRMGRMIRFRRSELDRWLDTYREGNWPAVEPRPLELEPDQLSLFPLAAN